MMKRHGKKLQPCQPGQEVERDPILNHKHKSESELVMANSTSSDVLLAIPHLLNLPQQCYLLRIKCSKI